MQAISKNWTKRFFIMLISVIIMGFSLSLLVLTNFGTDPCSAMNYGISRQIGISFGTIQLLLNLILFVPVLCLYREGIGWGTIGNMVLVGYATDFFSYLWNHLFNLTAPPALPIRLLLLVFGITVFVISAACYMNSGLGVAPYDAVPYLLNDRWMKRTGGKNHFRIFRFCLDLTCTTVGFLAGGESGAVTVLMVILLAPAVQLVGKFFERLL